jgi:hypothetical protein
MLMRKPIVLLILLAGAAGLILGQTYDINKLKAAYDCLEKKDYASSLKLFQEIYARADKSDRYFRDIAYGRAASLFFSLGDVMKRNDWNRVIELGDGLITVLDADKDVLDPVLLEKKYWAVKDLIVAYFGLGQRDKAKPFQEVLYEAYQQKQLPEGINLSYNFEKFVHDGLNVWGYESYAQLADQEPGASFSKHVYYIFSRDNEGNDKEELFTLETVGVHKLSPDLPDFVLTRRVRVEESLRSETYWDFTFNDPVDYEKLHQAIIEFLKGGAKPSSTSITKIRKAASP